MVQHPWLKFAYLIKRIAQEGRNDTQNPSDEIRYDELNEISNEMVRHLVTTNITAIDRCFLPGPLYVSPKVDTRGGLFRDDSILLIRETGETTWSLPGGWTGPNESPVDGIAKDARRQTGYDVTLPHLVSIKNRRLHGYTPAYLQHTYKVFFLCDYMGGDPIPGPGVDEIAFFSIDQLPELSLEKVLPEDILLLSRFAKKEETSIYLD